VPEVKTAIRIQCRGSLLQGISIIIREVIKIFSVIAIQEGGIVLFMSIVVVVVIIVLLTKIVTANRLASRDYSNSVILLIVISISAVAVLAYPIIDLLFVH